jgi:thioredoxin 1
MENVLKLDAQNFAAEVTSSGVPVLVDFWAPWCGPCKMIGPIIEEIAGEFAGKAKVGKVNVDDNQALATQFGIRGIPTVMIFKGGAVVGSFVGVQPKAELTSALTAALA